MRKARRAIIVVYRIISQEYAESRSLPPISPLNLMLTQLGKLQLTNVNAIQNGGYNSQCESDYDSSDDNMLASIASNTIQIEPKNTTLQIGNTQVGLLIAPALCVVF